MVDDSFVGMSISKSSVFVSYFSLDLKYLLLRNSLYFSCSPLFNSFLLFVFALIENAGYQKFASSFELPST